LIYLDASVVVAALTSEPNSRDVRAWLDTQDNDGLAVSNWTRVEVASALSIKARRKELTPEQQQRALQVFDVLANGSINWVLVAPVAEDFEVAEQMAGQATLNLRGADALHIAIAYRHDWVLATLDKEIVAAAQRTGVVVELGLLG
jgi:hypothetical protein